MQPVQAPQAPASPRKKNAKRSAKSSANRDPAGIDPALRHQMIATAAYYRAERCGFDNRETERNWYAAEHEVERMLQDAADDQDIVRLEALLSEWDARFEELQARVAKAAAKSRAAYRKQLQAIADKRGLLTDRLEQLRQHGGALWGDFRRAVEQGWEEIRQETEHLAARLLDEKEAAPAAKKKEKAAKK
jgi:hypothetical protein